MNKTFTTDLIKHFSLEVIHGVDEKMELNSIEINRCGLQLAGFYTYFVPNRIQIVGKNEWSYFETLSSEQRKKIADKFLSYELPMVVFTRNQEVFPEFLQKAEQYGRLIVRTALSTTIFMSKITDYLEEKLAPSVTIHGVFVDVYGVGVAIMGKSGVGKSEIALELVKRGHRFIADDAIHIKKNSDNMLIGTAPEIIQNLLEIRGIGILDVAKLYGLASIRYKKFLDLVVQLEDWEAGKVYDRLGLDDETINILDVEIPILYIPVKGGRNLAIIIEAAAINYKTKLEGNNVVQELDKRIQKSSSYTNLT